MSDEGNTSQQQELDKEPQDSGLKTPTGKESKIPRDESFRTCKTTVLTPGARRQGLRATPMRNSILSGGKPFKEYTSSGKKFNSRRKNVNSAQRNKMNDTGGSNETFIRHEQELMFDRDSLDVADPKMSSTPKPFCFPDEPTISEEIVLPEVPTPKVLKPRISKPKSPTKNENIKMPPPPPASVASTKTKPKPRLNYSRMNNDRFVTPKPTFRKPSSVMSSASSSRYLSQWNNSRIVRAQSFKSTAELEREYFYSLRSKF